MSKRAPSTTQLLVIAGFALSCFGILLFLWVTFGGPTPLQAEAYEIKIPFNEATQLAAAVRRPHLRRHRRQSPGHRPGAQRQAGAATIEIDDQYAPIPTTPGRCCAEDAARRDLRRTHAGQPRRPKPLPEDGTLPRRTSRRSVQLDEIFRTFNAPTRAAFQDWMQQAAIALHGPGQNLYYALGELEPFTESANALPHPLDASSQAVRQLFRGGGETFRRAVGARRASSAP